MSFQLRPYQRDAVESAKEELKKCVDPILIEGATGCHEKGHPILMHDGSIKKVEDINVGDVVMGVNSSPKTVTSLARGVDDMYLIIPTKGEPFIINGGHILNLYVTPRTKGKKPNYVNMSVNEYLATSNTFKHRAKLWRDKVCSFVVDEENLPLDPHFLGVLIGDGHIVSCVEVSTPDIEIFAEIHQIAEKFGLKVSVNNNGTISPSYRIYDDAANRGRRNKIMSILDDLGLSGSRAGDKFIPEMYKLASRDNRLELLAGLIDTDGHLTHSGYDYVTKSKQLADDIVFVCRSVGLAAYSSQCTKSCQGGFTGEYYRISISGDCSIIPCRIERKISLKREQIKRVNVTGFKVECIGKGDYYGFNLHGDRLYLDGYFNVHHNCGKSLLVSELAIWLKETSGKKVLCTAPSKELVEQNAEKYRSYGFACSMYSASVGKKSIAKDVVFGTPGSIVNDLNKFDDKFSAIVIDECLTGDSLIETTEGQIRLDDPKLKNKLIKCINEESGTIYYHKANKVWNNGTKHVSLIKTTEGEIKCTENHLLHSKDSWIYSKDVKIGQSLTLDGSKDFVMKKLLRAVVAVAKRLMF